MSNHRSFLKEASLSVIGAAGLSLPNLTSVDRSVEKPDSIDAIRDGLMLDENIAYLNTGSLGPSPRWALERYVEFAKI